MKSRRQGKRRQGKRSWEEGPRTEQTVAEPGRFFYIPSRAAAELPQQPLALNLFTRQLLAGERRRGLVVAASILLRVTHFLRRLEPWGMARGGTRGAGRIALGLPVPRGPRSPRPRARHSQLACWREFGKQMRKERGARQAKMPTYFALVRTRSLSFAQGSAPLPSSAP